MERPKKYNLPGEGPEGLFSSQLPSLPVRTLAESSLNATPLDVQLTLRKPSGSLDLYDFTNLISPAAATALEQLALQCRAVTRNHFGKAVRLFAPLYLSNECVNICRYCGFSRNNSIPRKTLPVHHVVEATAKLARQGFRNVLLVAGEHPKWVANGYVRECVERCLEIVPEIALELGPMETAEYRPLVQAGAEALIVYQEVYDQPSYARLHTAGPKKFFAWRLDTPERGYSAGFRRLGIGTLLGLAPWRFEAIALAAHARHLQRHCWKAQISISLPRMRPTAGGFQPDPRFAVTDREFVQLICALRLLLPNVGITLSTRESPALRDGLMPLGVTLMSAGASTEPGGYDHFDESSWTTTNEQPGEQFSIADERSPATIATKLRALGLEAVWKDFDRSLILEAAG